jgi:hypothetical protein
MTFAAAKQYSITVARNMQHKLPLELRQRIYDGIMDVDQTVRSLKMPLAKHAHGEGVDELAVAMPRFLSQNI